MSLNTHGVDVLCVYKVLKISNHLQPRTIPLHCYLYSHNIIHIYSNSYRCIVYYLFNHVINFSI